MSNNKPRILARFVQDSLQSIDETDSVLGGRVREALKPETLTAIKAASAVGWLDVALDVELTETFFQVAGPEVAQQVLRKNMATTCGSAVLRPMIDGSLALFGPSPEKFLRWTSKVWWLLSRDCGQLELQSGDEHSGTIEMTDIPPEIVASRNYLLGMGAAILGVFDAIKLTARCELEQPESGLALFRLEWGG